MANLLVAWILGRLGLSAAAATLWAPKVIVLIQTLISFYKAWESGGGLDAARAAVKAALRDIHPHLVPTPEEEAAEMERASKVGSGGG